MKIKQVESKTEEKKNRRLNSVTFERLREASSEGLGETSGIRLDPCPAPNTPWKDRKKRVEETGHENVHW
jgi:hypothetical protein